MLTAVPTHVLLLQETRGRLEERIWRYKDYAIFTHIYSCEDEDTWNLATAMHLDALNLVAQFMAGTRWQSLALKTQRGPVKFVNSHLQLANSMALYAEPPQQTSELEEETSPCRRHGRLQRPPHEHRHAMVAQGNVQAAMNETLERPEPQRQIGEGKF